MKCNASAIKCIIINVITMTIVTKGIQIFEFKFLQKTVWQQENPTLIMEYFFKNNFPARKLELEVMFAQRLKHRVATQGINSIHSFCQRISERFMNCDSSIYIWYIRCIQFWYTRVSPCQNIRYSTKRAWYSVTIPRLNKLCDRNRYDVDCNP